MKKLIVLFLVLVSCKGEAQNEAFKMDVPAIALGEMQNFQVLSFEALAQDKFSILYAQELQATVVGEREFRNEKYVGAYLDSELKKSVPHSGQVLMLVRQIVNKNGDAATNFWVVALRELESDMKYTMYYPPSFVHPMLKDVVPVTNSLKNLDQINGLSSREMEALTQLAKQKYSFYEYQIPAFVAQEPTLLENIQLLKSGFKELKTALGKGDIPKEEKLLFKREILDNIKIAATKIDKKDSVDIKLYLSRDGGSNYDMLKQETFAGSTNPGFATTLVYNQSLKVSGAFGHVLLKYKDEAGVAKAYFLLLGIDDNGEPGFWHVEAGKNTLNSFIPWFSHVDENGIYVISYNNEKIFKPQMSHHLLKRDGSVNSLFPSVATEAGTEKTEYLYTEQVKQSPNSGGFNGQSYSSSTPENIPVGLFYRNNHKYVFMGKKTVRNDGSAVTTTYGSISLMHIDADGKIKETYSVEENQSAGPVYARLLGNYTNKAYFMFNYPNMFEVLIADDKIETVQTENSTTRLVYTSSGDYLSINKLGSMLLTKTVAGNKYTLEFFPTN